MKLLGFSFMLGVIGSVRRAAVAVAVMVIVIVVVSKAELEVILDRLVGRRLDLGGAELTDAAEELAGAAGHSEGGPLGLAVVLALRRDRATAEVKRPGALGRRAVIQHAQARRRAERSLVAVLDFVLPHQQVAENRRCPRDL